MCMAKGNFLFAFVNIAYKIFTYVKIMQRYPHDKQVQNLYDIPVLEWIHR